MVHSPCHTEHMGPNVSAWAPLLARLISSPVQIWSVSTTSTYMMVLAEPFDTKPLHVSPDFLVPTSANTNQIGNSSQEGSPFLLQMKHLLLCTLSLILTPFRTEI